MKYQDKSGLLSFAHLSLESSTKAESGTGVENNPPLTERLWTVQDVAAYLQCSKSYVYQKSEAGLIPSVRAGGLLRFEPAAVRAWATSDRTGNTVNPSHR